MTDRHRRWRALIAASLLLIALCSCSIDAEGTPRDIPVRDRRDLRANFDQAGGRRPGRVGSTCSRQRSSASRAHSNLLPET